MKGVILAGLLSLIFVTASEEDSAQTITVTGAGTFSADGVYYKDGSYNGQPLYKKAGDFGRIAYTTKGWVIAPVGTYDPPLYVKNNTAGIPSEYPPDGIWSIQSGAVGAPPAPSSVYDASLPVELHSFSATPCENWVWIAWETESETDNLGFILERAVGGYVETRFIASLRWEVIASYETHPALRGQGNASERHDYTFVDESVEGGSSYTYRLSDVNTSGDVHVYDEINITLPDAPEETVLEPPFPNPFNPQTKVTYQLAKAGAVEIIVYDLLGRTVGQLVNENQSAGSYKVYWYGDDASGRKVATGTYLIVLKTIDRTKTQKVVMLR